MSVPSAPQIQIRPLARDGSLQMFWSAPVSDGGSPITGYTLSCSGLTTQNLSASTFNYEYTGLTNGTPYTFQITAENANGSSPAATFRTVEPGNVPGVVTGLTASRTASPQISLNWTAPASNGGADIGWYVVKATNTNGEEATIRQNVAHPSTAITFGGLSSDSVYNYSVQAVNDPGYSAEATTGLYSLAPTWNKINLEGDLNVWSGVSCDISGNKVLANQSFAGSPLYQSTNAGTTWFETIAGFPLGFGALTWRRTASSDNGTVLYVTSSTYIFRSNNSGALWTQSLAVSGLIFNAIACSADGTIAIASTTNSSLYVTTNSGVTWTAQVSPSTRNWTSVCCSKNGQFMMAVGSNFSGWSTSNAGGSWTQQTGLTSRAYTGITCSSDGTQVVASATNLIVRSSDSGVTWSTVLTIPTAQSSGSIFQSVASSTDGTKLVGVTTHSVYQSTDSGTTWRRSLVTWSTLTGFLFVTCSGDGSRIFIARFGGNIWRSVNTGSTWQELVSPRYNSVQAIASSSDGTKQYAVEVLSNTSAIWKSSNGGVTWTANQDSTRFKSFRWVCCSADGSFVAATESTNNAGWIWTSSDSGATWTQQTAAGGRNWRGIACDVSGTKLVAAAPSAFIYTSTDAGVTWTERTGAGFRSWRAVASSADGTKLFAADSATGGFIYTSTDSGATWTQQTGAGGRVWISMACSSNGQIVLAGVSFGPVFLSTDGGVTWTQTSLPSGGFYNGVAMTPDGTKMLAADTSNALYLSTNSGSTWTEQTKLRSQQIQGVAMNSDASIMTASITTGMGLWVYRQFG